MKVGTVAYLSIAISTVLGASSVYEINHDFEGKTPSVSSDTAWMYLADKLGRSKELKLSDAEDVSKTIEELDGIYESVGMIESRKPKLLATISGADIKEIGMKPIFKTEKIQSPDMETTKYMAYSLQCSTSPKTHKKLLHHFTDYESKLMEIWQSYKVGGNDQVVLGNNLELMEEKSFIDDISRLIHLETVPQMGHDNAVMYTSRFLNVASEKWGQSSAGFKLAQKLLIDQLVKLGKRYEVTLVASEETESEELLQVPTREQEVEGIFAKYNNRRQESENAFANYNKRSASCFTNEEECQVGTSNCNSHGVCSKVKSGCWQCLCSSSYNKTTSKTTNWSGFDCGVKDVSSPAHLLLWTTIALVIAFAGGVKMLFDVGSESLPGVLDAATSSKKAV